jgi:hypothetical protein
MDKNIIGEFLPKNNLSKTNSQSYQIIDCQNVINNNYNTSNWIKLDDVIQKKRDVRIFKGLLQKTNNIVVKIGKSETIEKEFLISNKLRDIPGFIKYLCYFKCNNIIANSSICSNEGDENFVLLMRYYKFGSIKNYD